MSITPMQLSIEGPPQAPVLVIANSLAATSAMWNAQCAVWRQRWRLVRFDYAGHNAPDFTADAPDSIEGIGSALLTLLDAKQIDRFSFVGLSLGGMLGLHLAAAASGRVERLVVANCRYHQTEPLKKQWDERIAAVRAGGMEAIADITVDRWLTAGFRAQHPDQANAIRAMVCRTSRQGYAAAATAVRNFDARPTLSAIHCPVLVVGGAQDGAAPAEHLAELAAKLSAQHLALDPCAHLSSVERAETLTTECGAFLL